MIKASGVIGSLKKTNDTINIFGAGICGLIFAYRLKQAGLKVRLHEKSYKVGGKISTKKSEFGLTETAANAVYSSPEVIQLFKELDISYITPSKSLKKLIYRSNKAQRFPFRFFELIKVIFSLFKKIPQDPKISVHDFFVPLLGEKLCQEVLQALFNGVYASPIKELHFKSLFKSTIKANTYIGFILEMKKNKSGFKAQSLSFKNGMQDLVDKLKSNLKDEIILNSDTVISKDQVNIICTDSMNAALLTQESYPAIASLLNEVEYTHLNSFTIFTKDKIQDLEGAFGILRPYSKDMALGILNNSSIFKDRVFHQGLNSYTFISKASQIDSEFKKLDLTCEHKTLWTRALPIYNYNRFETIKKLRAESYNIENLAIFGNYVDGISIREMIFHINNFTLKLSQQKG